MAQSTSSRFGALSARLRQIQRNHKHGRREHVERKSKHSIHSVGWLAVWKSTPPDAPSARQVEGSRARSCEDVILRKDPSKQDLASRVWFRRAVATASPGAQPHAGAQEFLRVDRFAVDPGFIMQMWTGRSAGRANFANYLSDLDLIADFHVDF
jgi:hypothetical protein